LEEHCELFVEEERGVAVSTATMSRALKDLGLPLKKDARLLRTRRAGEGSVPRKSGRGGPESAFVWVDECGTHTSMTRLRARAPRGEREREACP